MEFRSFLADLIFSREWRWNYYFKPLYLVNKRSSEIHLLSNIQAGCNTDRISESNELIMTVFDLDHYRLTHPRANGCVHCNKPMDTDIYNKPNKKELKDARFVKPFMISRELLLWS